MIGKKRGQFQNGKWIKKRRNQLLAITSTLFRVYYHQESCWSAPHSTLFSPVHLSSFPTPQDNEYKASQMVHDSIDTRRVEDMVAKISTSQWWKRNLRDDKLPKQEYKMETFPEKVLQTENLEVS